MSFFGIIPPSWQDGAKCAKRNRITGERPNPELWVTSNLKRAPHRQRHAAELCAGCPVIGQCAEDAVRMRAAYVVRAGVALESVEDNEEMRLYEKLDAIAKGHKASQESRSYR
jgi:hypothetical protein